MICSTHAFFPIHCERDAELVQMHVDKGDEVTWIVCAGEFDRCDNHVSLGPNPERIECAVRCLQCIDRMVRSGQRVSGNPRKVRFSSLREWHELMLPSVPEFEDLEALKRFSWQGFDAGFATASSLITWSRSPSPCTIEFRDFVKRMLLSSLRVYSAFRQYLRGENPDHVYVTNGRCAHTRALFRACEAESVKCLIHDSGSTKERYHIYENAMPHNRAYIENEIRAFWAERGDDSGARATADSWYRMRAQGIDLDWISYVKKQQEGRLPNKWSEGREKIVYFSSSEDEFASIGPEWKNGLFDRQIDSITALKATLGSVRPGADLIVRMHPNLAGSTAPELEEYFALEDERTIVVRPESPVSSYALLREADIVVTFGSTMGIEATYWGKPSVLLGLSYYRNLGGTHNVASHDDLTRIFGGEIHPCDREAAIMYGFYTATFGTAYVYYRADRFLEGTFRGVDLTDTSGVVEQIGTAVGRYVGLKRKLLRILSR